MVRSLIFAGEAVLITVGLVAVLTGCMDASLSQSSRSAATGITLQQAPDGVEEVTISISGSGMSTVTKTISADSGEVVLEVPVGEGREFTAEAGDYSVSVVRDVPVGGVTVALRFVSVDGTLLFWRGDFVDDGDDGYLENADIYTIEDASNEEQVTDLSSPRIDTAFWTGDGEWIVFKSYHDEETYGELYRVRPDGSQLARLTNNTDPETLGGVEGDGSRITYSRPDTDGITQVYVVDAGATSPTPTNVSNSGTDNYGFTLGQDDLDATHNVSVGRDVVDPWSPDASQLLYSREWDSDYPVYLDDAAGGNKSVPGYDGLFDGVYVVGAQWLPDGETILYSAGDDTNMDLWLYDVSADVFSQLTNSADVIDKYPRISPDGTAVLFQRSGEYRLTDLSGNENPVSNASEFTPAFVRWVPSSSELSAVGYNDNTGSYELRFYDTSGSLLETMPYDAEFSSGSIPLQWNASGTFASGVIAETNEQNELTQYDLTVFNRETEDVIQVTETSSVSELGGIWRP